MLLSPIFKTLDAMAIRTQLGTLLDQVELNNSRFAIQRRGKLKALLVPLSDRQNIEDHLANDKIDQTYAALRKIKGSVTDPAMHDASTTIDNYLYGHLSQEADD